MQTFRHLVLIISLAGVTFFVNLGQPKLWDRDEPRNAQCAVEMLDRNDWTVPTFNGELRTHKPILLYWLMISSYQTFGVSEFSARFWSAFFGVATAVVTYWIGRNISNSRTALNASLILVTTLMFSVSSRAATPDSTLIFFCALSFAIFSDGINRGANSIPTRLHWLGVYSAMGGAVLTKGPVGFVLPCIAIGGYRMLVLLNEKVTCEWQGNKLQKGIRLFTDYVAQFFPALKQMRPLIALVAISAIALPWYVVVGIKTNGEWLEGFFWKHNIQRATAAMEGHNGSFALYYPVAILAGFFPWSVFAVPTVLTTWRRLKNSDADRNIIFLLCWIGAFVGVFSIAQTKLPSYVTPIYPAIALLVALLFDGEREFFDKKIQAWMVAALSVLSVVGATICVGGWITVEAILPREKWICLVGLLPFIAGVIGLIVMRKFSHVAMQQMFQVFSFLFVIVIFGWCAGRVSRNQEFDKLFASHEITSTDSRLATFASQEPSWVFYWGKPINHFRQQDPSQAIDFLKQGGENYLITTGKRLGKIKRGDDKPVGCRLRSELLSQEKQNLADQQHVKNREKFTRFLQSTVAGIRLAMGRVGRCCGGLDVAYLLPALSGPVSCFVWNGENLRVKPTKHNRSL